MINFTTNQKYQGSNIEALSGLGSEFCTFRQAIKFFDLNGKELKGAKSCARLVKIVEKEVVDKITKKKEKKKVPMYFNVFEKNHLETVIANNK